MHPEIATALAHQHTAELHREADQRRQRAARGDQPRRAALRIRTGRTLVGWGHRLAPPPHGAPARPSAATMGT